MTLYSAPPSYYSMIARLALNESKVTFETHKMDIHIAKDQLSSWYMAVNPHMTVPAFTENERTFTDSRDILNYAAKQAKENWCDSDVTLIEPIRNIVNAHYAISIEELTFGKMMIKHAFLRKLFPKILQRINQKLAEKLSSATDPIAIQNKISVNEDRLSYFTEGNLNIKFNDRKDEVRDYIHQLPRNITLLFGENTSSADIVTSVLFGRLEMIGENDLIHSAPGLVNWFQRIKLRPAFIKSDIWLRFKPWRIILKY